MTLSIKYDMLYISKTVCKQLAFQIIVALQDDDW